MVPRGPLGKFWASGLLAEVEILLGMLEAPLCPLGTLWTLEPLVEREVPFGSVGTFWAFELLAESEICLDPLGQFFVCFTSSG